MDPLDVPLITAVRANDLKAMAEAVEQGARTGEVGASGAAQHCSVFSLHIAAAEGHLEALKWLIDHGADVNSVGEGSLTALHYAALNGHVPVMEWLVIQDADLKATNDESATALHLSVEKGHLAAANWLAEQIEDVATPGKMCGDKRSPLVCGIVWLKTAHQRLQPS